MPKIINKILNKSQEKVGESNPVNILVRPFITNLEVRFSQKRLSVLLGVESLQMALLISSTSLTALSFH